MDVNNEAIYGTQASSLQNLSWGRVTKKEKNENTILYLSVFEWPQNGKLVIPEIKNQVVSANVLGKKKKLKTNSGKNGLANSLHGEDPNKIGSLKKVKLIGSLNEK